MDPPKTPDTPKRAEISAGVDQGPTGTARGRSAATYLQESEKANFVEYINHHLKGDTDLKDVLPVDGKSVFEAVKNGVLLAKFILLISPGAIDTKKFHLVPKSRFDFVENANAVIAAATSIGCQFTNIGVPDILDGKPNLMLSMFWQLIRTHVVHKMLEASGGDWLGAEDAARLKTKPHDVIAFWANEMLKRSGANLSRQFKSLTVELQDSELLAHLLGEVDKEKIQKQTILSEADIQKRAELALSEADKLQFKRFISATDIVQGNQKLMFIFLSQLFVKTAQISGQPNVIGTSEVPVIGIDSIKSASSPSLSQRGPNSPSHSSDKIAPLSSSPSAPGTIAAVGSGSRISSAGTAASTSSPKGSRVAGPGSLPAQVMPKDLPPPSLPPPSLPPLDLPPPAALPPVPGSAHALPPPAVVPSTPKTAASSDALLPPSALPLPSVVPPAAALPTLPPPTSLPSQAPDVALPPPLPNALPPPSALPPPAALPPVTALPPILAVPPATPKSSSTAAAPLSAPLIPPSGSPPVPAKQQAPPSTLPSPKAPVSIAVTSAPPTQVSGVAELQVGTPPAGPLSTRSAGSPRKSSTKSGSSRLDKGEKDSDSKEKKEKKSSSASTSAPGTGTQPFNVSARGSGPGNLAGSNSSPTPQQQRAAENSSSSEALEAEKAKLKNATEEIKRLNTRAESLEATVRQRDEAVNGLMKELAQRDTAVDQREVQLRDALARERMYREFNARIGLKDLKSAVTKHGWVTMIGDDKKRKRYAVLRGQSLYLFKSDRTEKEKRNKETIWFGAAKMKAADAESKKKQTFQIEAAPLDEPMVLQADSKQDYEDWIAKITEAENAAAEERRKREREEKDKKEKEIRNRRASQALSTSGAPVSSSASNVSPVASATTNSGGTNSPILTPQSSFSQLQSMRDSTSSSDNRGSRIGLAELEEDDVEVRLMIEKLDSNLAALESKLTK